MNADGRRRFVGRLIQRIDFFCFPLTNTGVYIQNTNIYTQHFF